MNRQEYIQASSIDSATERSFIHHQYYMQFSNPALERLVLNTFGFNQLKKAYAIDRHFNNIPLKQWDSLLSVFKQLVDMQKIKSSGEGMSLSTCVCTLKNIAQALVERDDPALVEPTTKWVKDIFFGERKDDLSQIFIQQPSWDCGWYWSFGYLGNYREHYHLHGYANGRNINMYDALLADYQLNPKIANNLWKFCELALTAYSLKTAAEVLGRGGSHMTTNPVADIIKNPAEVDRINKQVLPAIFDAIAEIIQE